METCKVCGAEIQIAIFRGTEYCSVLCKKAGGQDVSSVGEYMFVTAEEASSIRRLRNG